MSVTEAPQNKEFFLIEEAFQSSFVRFEDNPYAKSTKLSDVDLRWQAAGKAFADKIEKLGVTKEDLVMWISEKAFQITDDHEEAHKNDNIWDYSRIFA